MLKIKKFSKYKGKIPKIGVPDSGISVPQSGVFRVNLCNEKFGQQTFVPQIEVFPQIGVRLYFVRVFMEILNENCPANYSLADVVIALPSFKKKITSIQYPYIPCASLSGNTMP